MPDTTQGARDWYFKFCYYAKKKNQKIIGWCKSTCDFALLNSAAWYWNTALNKYGYVIIALFFC